MADYIYRADKFFQEVHRVLELIDAYVSNEQICLALKQCNCQTITGPGNWFNIGDPSKLTYCDCGITTSHHGRTNKNGVVNRVNGCPHFNLLYHRQGCSLQTYDWPADHCRKFKQAYDFPAIDSAFISAQKLYEEVRPGFLEYWQALEIIDIFYVLMLNAVDRAFPDENSFIGPALKFLDISASEIINVKIKMRAFGYKDSIIDKLCEYF